MTNRRGFALLVALWLLVALSAASLALATMSRTRRLAAANYAENVRARAAAQAGIEVVRARLAERLATGDGRPDPWSGVDSLNDTLMLGQANATAFLYDVGSALNLNRADENQLRRFFTALRIDAGLADRLAQAIGDWRDADDFPRARGAERDEYLRSGAAELPRNGLFERVEELQAVQGMTTELFHEIRPYLTVLGSGQINVNAAPRPVLLSLPGITPEAADVLLRNRGRGRSLGTLADLERDLSPGAREVLRVQLPVLLSLTTTETREVEVVSVGALPGSPVRARVTALLVRARDAVFYVWSRTE
jgi:general secretion pathway protein K